MAELDEVRSRDTAKRRISELTRQVGDEARVEKVTVEEWSAREEVSRRRMSATLLVGAGALFLTGLALLTAGTYSDEGACGTALSNRGWPGGTDCYGTVVGYGWAGVAAIVISIGLALAARLVRWPDLD